MQLPPPPDLFGLLPFLMTVVFITLLGVLIWKQPERPGKRYFVLIFIIWLIWALAALLEFFTHSPGVRFAVLVIQFACALLAAIAELLFGLEYSGRRKWLSPGMAAIPVGIVLIISIVLATNPWHHLFWSAMPFGAAVIQVRTPYAWIPIVFHYCLWLINAAVLINCMLRAPAFWSPIVVLLAGQLIPRIAFFLPNAITIINLSPLQLTILTTNFTALAYFLALYNFRLLRVLPLARDVVLDQMALGIFVLDADERLVDLNPAARALLRLSKSVRVGQPARQALGAWAGQLSSFSRQEPGSQEILIHDGEKQQVFDVHSLPLLHTSGWPMGQVFIISDITPAWRARRQLMQQQWAEATLQEREQLAYELHDGLSQNLAFLNVQAQAAQVYVTTGQPEMARACLDRLIEVSGLIQNDTREMINQLMGISLPAEGFLANLRQVLASFEQLAGLQTKLMVDPRAEAACGPDVLDSSIVVQLLRIIQEALANVRKHAQNAEQVEVQMEIENSELHVTITDNGKGFEAQPQISDTRHFGLKIMRQRAIRIGARLTIQSVPGRGTIIEVCLPIGGDKKEQ